MTMLKSGCVLMASRNGSGPIWATIVTASSISGCVSAGTEDPQPVMPPDWMDCETVTLETLLYIARVLKLYVLLKSQDLFT